MSLFRSIVFVLAALLVLGACGSDDEVVSTEPDDGIGSSPFGDVPFFGSNDDQCTSVTLSNDADDDRLRTEALECFFSEYDTGSQVVVDLSIPTVEGDPIYHRYHYDGSSVLIVIDTRLDAFGAGAVSAQRCAGLEPGPFLPSGVDCESVDHPGFPEAG